MRQPEGVVDKAVSSIGIGVNPEVEGSSLLCCMLPGHGLVGAAALEDQDVGQGTNCLALQSGVLQS